MNTVISGAAFLVSLCSLLFSLFLWKRSSRPIVSVAVKTHNPGNVAIAYDLVVLNSGTIPARNIRIQAKKDALDAALGQDATAENKRRWLACFNVVIGLLHNGDRVSCSFGTTQANNTGFWKYNVCLPIEITYEDWFGWKYRDIQTIRIATSDSFTGYSWEASRS
jgi:hypothetical protein